MRFFQRLGRSRSPEAEYVLANAEDRNREAPNSFLIPTREQRENFVPGDLVKLIFEVVGSGDREVSAERMWVQIIEAKAGSYVGTLDNHPQVITTIHPGCRILFGPEHVTAFWVDG